MGWTVPTSLLAHMMLTSGDGFGFARQLAAQGVWRHPSDFVDRQPGDFGSFIVDQPLNGIDHGVMLDSTRHNATTTWVRGAT